MTAPRPRVADLVSALRRQGVTHVVGLPDNASAPLFDLLLGPESPFRLVQVTREGEAFGVASGLWLGGARPVVVVQGTGLLESGDALRGTAARMGVPLVVLVTWRGWGKLAPAGLGRFAGGVPDGDAMQTGGAWPIPDRETLVRPDVDSAAVLLRPTLDAWGVPQEVYDSPGDGGRLAAAFLRAEREARPVAVLLPRAPA